jgi:hypothetical protein
MRLPVLCYHGMNVHGSEYANNDHIAFAADLRVLARLGRTVVPLYQAVAALLDRRDMPRNAVALSFDDGSWFDWHDLEHPSCGVQQSFARALREAAPTLAGGAHATSFVIVSPEARAFLDRTCMIDRGWWSDAWWRDAEAEGLIAIESHSWDHNHETLPGSSRGTFATIDDYAKADAEIRVASDWLAENLPVERPRLFAYPYGETNDYLVREYFPTYTSEHRCTAAFTTDARPMTSADDRWALPRYVCGRDWRTPEELQRVLADAR